MEIKEKLPNFLVIGAGKSGTTALYEYLNSHPEVFMSPIKETNFFALEGEQLVNPEDDPDQMKHYPWSVTQYSDYQDLFKPATEPAIGEVSPMYLYSEKAAQNIKKRLPDAKIIVILRQPVERLYSRYLHLAREDRRPTNDFSDALDKESIWWKRNDLVTEGFYYCHLHKYYRLFPKEQIKVILYEDFRSDPEAVLRDLYEFIGVSSTYRAPTSAEYNVSGFIVNKKLDKLIGQNSILKAYIKSLFPDLFGQLSKNSKVKAFVTKLRKKNMHKPAISKELKARMNAEIYKADIDNLQRLINRNLSHWQFN